MRHEWFLTSHFEIPFLWENNWPKGQLWASYPREVLNLPIPTPTPNTAQHGLNPLPIKLTCSVLALKGLEEGNHAWIPKHAELSPVQNLHVHLHVYRFLLHDSDLIFSFFKKSGSMCVCVYKGFNTPEFLNYHLFLSYFSFVFIRVCSVRSTRACHYSAQNGSKPVQSVQ